MTENNQRIPDVEVGERLRVARERVKLTQSDAAELIGAVRTTVVAIEKGQRRIRIDELQNLAKAYGTSANALLRRESVVLDLVPRFRKLASSSDDTIESACRMLNDLVQAEVELENMLGVHRPLDYPPERPMLPGDLRLQAEQDAQQLRDRLGLGPEPIADIISILELQLGIRVYVRPLPSRICGLFAFDEAAGACILLNSIHPTERLRNTAAHELGHFVSARRMPDVTATDDKSQSREERYAHAFAQAFLMPADAVKKQFAALTAGQSHLTRHIVIILSHFFWVSREAMVRRLEELGLARSGTWAWFEENGGITNVQVHEVLGDRQDRQLHPFAGQGLLPTRLSLLAREAAKRELYTEGQLARLLKLDRHGIREVLAGVDTEEDDVDALRLI